MPEVRKWLLVGFPVLIVLLVAAGIYGYYDERGSREVYSEVGPTGDGDRVELDLTAQRVDAPARELVLQVLPRLHGSRADKGNELVPAEDLVVETSSMATTTLRFKAHERVSLKEVRVALDEGVVSDFPFDRYTTTLFFLVEAGGAPVATSVSFQDHDPFFVTRLTAGDAERGAAVADVRVSRSRSTFILAWFQVIVMWALSLSVLGGATAIIRRGLGLVWPALGWMAATLFALVGFRNAAPGLPPIGSLIDYAAFFWAEAIITLSLVFVTVHGIRIKK